MLPSIAAAPALYGGLAAGAGALLGGLMGRRSQEKQLDRSIELQREFAKSGIQWRVEDAKAAGLHPLFALGASTSGPTIPVMEDPLAKGLSQAGQDVGRAVAAGQTDLQRMAAQTALNVAGSQIARNYAEAAMFDSQAARNYQAAGQSAPMPPSLNTLKPGPEHIASGGDAARIQVTPSQVVASSGGDAGIEAGVGTGMKWFNMPGSKPGQKGRRILLPAANSLSEALESVSESYLLAYVVARENMNANPNFIRENAHWFPYGHQLLEQWDDGDRRRRWAAAHEGEEWRVGRSKLFPPRPYEGRSFIRRWLSD